jgi:hypothetical protein
MLPGDGTEDEYRAPDPAPTGSYTVAKLDRLDDLFLCCRSFQRMTIALGGDCLVASPSSSGSSTTPIGRASALGSSAPRGHP